MSLWHWNEGRQYSGMIGLQWFNFYGAFEYNNQSQLAFVEISDRNRGAALGDAGAGGVQRIGAGAFPRVPGSVHYTSGGCAVFRLPAGSGLEVGSAVLEDKNTPGPALGEIQFGFAVGVGGNELVAGKGVPAATGRCG